MVLPGVKPGGVAVEQMQMTLAEAFAGRPGRFNMLDSGVLAAGWHVRKLKLLEVGCSVGDGAAHLAGREPVEITAIDMDAALICKAASIHGAETPGCTFLCADAERLPFESESFDGAYSEAAFSPAEDKRAVVSEYARIVKPGGRVLINDYAVKCEPDESLRGCGRDVPGLWGVQTMARYKQLFAEKNFVLVYEKEDISELIRLVMWLSRVYDGKPGGKGGYMEMVCRTWGRPCEDVSEFFRQARMTYCQMVFEKNE
jgi:SAM-dependent methyltransferase